MQQDRNSRASWQTLGYTPPALPKQRRLAINVSVVRIVHWPERINLQYPVPGFGWFSRKMGSTQPTLTVSLDSRVSGSPSSKVDVFSAQREWQICIRKAACSSIENKDLVCGSAEGCDVLQCDEYNGLRGFPLPTRYLEGMWASTRILHVWSLSGDSCLFSSIVSIDV